MGLIIFPKRWTGKPSLGAQINWGHPLANGLLHAFLLNEGGGSPGDLVLGQRGTLSAGTTWGQNSGGPALNFAAAADKVTLGDWASPGNVSHSVLFRGVMGTAATQRLAVGTGTASYGRVFFGVDSNNQWWVYLPSSANLYPGGSAAAGDFYSVGFNYNRLVNVSVDSLDLSTGARNRSTFAATNAPVAGANSFLGSDGGAGWRSSLNLAFLWNRLLSAGEFEWLHSEPYAFLLPQSPRIRYFIAPAAGTQYPQSLAAATAAFAGALAKNTNKTLPAAPSAWAAALAKSTWKSSSLAATPAAWAATLAKLTNKTSNLSAATAAFAGALAKQTNKALAAGNAAWAGALTSTKVKLQALAASMAAFAGTLAKQTGKGLAASMSAWAAALARFISRQIPASMAAWSGALAKLTSRTLTAATSAFAGALTSTKVKLQALAASMAAFAGTLAKQTGKGLAASMSAWAATLARRTLHAMAAGMAAWSAGLTKATSKILSAATSAWAAVLAAIKNAVGGPGPTIFAQSARVCLAMEAQAARVCVAMEAQSARICPAMEAQAARVCLAMEAQAARVCLAMEAQSARVVCN